MVSFVVVGAVVYREDGKKIDGGDAAFNELMRMIRL